MSEAHWYVGQAGTGGGTGGFGDQLCWTAAELAESDWLVELPSAALAEMDGVVASIGDRHGAIEALSPDAFEWPATFATMRRVAHMLRDGVGFVLLSRLPVERWGVPAARSVSWLLTAMLGPIVEQKLNGTRIYDVRDMKKPLGHGVRRSITNLEQEFHTDGGWLPQTPKFIALACLRQAARGGMSRVSSLATAHESLRTRAPALLDRLYQPFWWDRQAEHAKGERPCNHEPLFYAGERTVEARYYDDYVRQGHRLMDEPLDTTTRTALDAFRAIVEQSSHCVDFYLEPGQIEFVNNRAIAHARTRFEDAGEADAGRHLVRLWVRTTGGTALEPVPAGNTPVA